MSSCIILLVLLLQVLPDYTEDTFQVPEVPGIIVTHEPVSSGVFVGAPSICILPDGSYRTSVNYTAIEQKDRGSIHRSAIFRSGDRGMSWTRIADIDHQRWSTLFFHGDALYLLGVNRAFGDIVIRRSDDMGLSWTDPQDSISGLLAEGRYHCAPVPVVSFGGKLWRAMEYAEEGREFQAFMMSVPEEADLLRADSWTFSERVPFDPDWLGGNFMGWLEGNAVLTKDRKIVDILRCSLNGRLHSTAAIIGISEDGRNAGFSPDTGFICFPGGSKKFTIHYDPESDKYWSLVNWIQPPYLKYLENFHAGRIRNTLAMVSSRDLSSWIIERIILFHEDMEYHGFQYVDWQFEGPDIVAVSRTAFDDEEGGANSAHDANYITFHRIRNFRDNFNNWPESDGFPAPAEF